jgi:hypothetical protein
MKNVICFLLILSAIYTSSAQETIPSQVLDAFSEQEPNVQQPFWEHREGAFVAMFSDEDGLKKIFFNDYGVWLETRTRMSQNELPSGVINFIDQHYSGADITYIGKVKKSNGIAYRVESELASAVVIKLLNEEGKLLEEERIDWNHVYTKADNKTAVPLLETKLPLLIKQ